MNRSSLSNFRIELSPRVRKIESEAITILSLVQNDDIVFRKVESLPPNMIWLSSMKKLGKLMGDFEWLRASSWRV